MCTIGVKFLKNIGWVGFKNRDRNYYACVTIKKDIDKIYIWDTITKYSEGLSAAGIGILLASLVMSEDEDEITTARRNAANGEVYYSPAGQKIREALSHRTIDEVVQCLIDSQTTGHILVFNKDICFSLESSFKLSLGGKVESNKYESVTTEIKQEDSQIVRTNHGVLLPYAGYLNNTEQRRSSNSRKIRVEEKLKFADSLEGIIDAFSDTESQESQLNPLRLSPVGEEKCTTGQIMIIPSSKQLLYRPVLGGFIDNPQINQTPGLTFTQLSAF